MNRYQKEPIPVTANLPYPPIRVLRQNSNYAKILAPAIRATGSEITSATTYFYQNWILTGCDREVADTIGRIAQVEIHHLNIIGSIITLLGGDPKFVENPTSFWNGNAVNYSQDYKELIQLNIEAEKGAASFYEEQSVHIKDPHISAMLKRIAADERLHVSIFEGYYSKCSK